jgi:methionyl-tRNA synthetase
MISFNEFKRVELKVAKVEEAQDVKGKDRLYVLKINLGDESRTIVAGLKPYYSKEELTGKHIVVVANLEPATIAGIKSEAMLLAARTKDGSYKVLELGEEVAPGTPVE